VQQIVEAFPFDTAPSYLIRDGDGTYGERVTQRIESLGIDEVVTAPASPRQNAYVKRVIGTLRRELFDHVIVSFRDRGQVNADYAHIKKNVEPGGWTDTHAGICYITI